MSAALDFSLCKSVRPFYIFIGKQTLQILYAQLCPAQGNSIIILFYYVPSNWFRLLGYHMNSVPLAYPVFCSDLVFRSINGFLLTYVMVSIHLVANHLLLPFPWRLLSSLFPSDFDLLMSRRWVCWWLNWKDRRSNVRDSLVLLTIHCILKSLHQKSHQ